jgi:uncharacterized protein YbaR (Trm112 family)
MSAAESETDSAWLESYLSRLRCPDTHQPLRWATPEECAQWGWAAVERSALAREDGSRLFPIDDGIPILLPMAAGQD